MHILYLEDDPIDALLLERYTRTTPHTITIANTLEQAKTILADNPDLILVDMLLGDDRAGFGFVDSLRRQGYQQPIIGITALVLPRDMEQCRASGCTEVIQKPYSIDVLDKLFDQYLTTGH